MTFKHGSITVTLLPDGNVRLASPNDTLMVERADLDDAIRGLCALRQLVDPVGYTKFVDEKLLPYVIIDSGWTYRDLLKQVSKSGTKP